jgi:hypothetical protein
VAEPRMYHCWAGCSKEMIRAALGCPVPSSAWPPPNRVNGRS